MKPVLVFLLMAASAFTSCDKVLEKGNPNNDCGPVSVNALHPMKDSLQAIIDRYIVKGIPGIQVALKNKNGWYFTSGGYAVTETKEKFTPCTPGWIFSITKTYTAALVMKEKERGTIGLDKPISRYLPKHIADSITGSSNITVRQLLSHTSGIVDHTTLPQFLERQFTDPAHQPTMQENIRMVYGRQLMFAPGTDFFYCNTNFLLLHFILENITGKSYEYLLRSEILQPLGLQNTYYNLGTGQVKNLHFPNYYLDRNQSGTLENATEWNNYVGNACFAYGGIAATPADVILFYEALVKGRVVKPSSLQEMTTWVQGRESTEPDYGLGIEHFQFASKTTAQFGHEGDGIGNSTVVMYVPDTDTYLYVNCTAGRKLGGPYLFKITDFKNEIRSYVASRR
jgi:D-alanyl-D-alanine carboxypeptidase